MSPIFFSETDLVADPVAFQGGLPVAICIIPHPTLHTSQLRPQCSPSTACKHITILYVFFPYLRSHKGTFP